MMFNHLISLLAYFVVCVSSQSLSTVLPLQSGLTKFTSLINQYPDLVAQLDAGNYTLLAPSDDAFSVYITAGGNIEDTSVLRALLEYHILQDLHPSLNFDATPQFLPSILTNQSYTNVTGGQVVEVIGLNGEVSIYSAVKAQSKITIPDALFMGGLIHQIDKVLTIPITTPATITAAGLNDFVALLNRGGWLTDPVSVQTVIDMQDLSCFGVNSPEYSSSYTGFEGLDSASLLEIFDYALVVGPVAYSSRLQNGTVMKTLAGKDITVTLLGNDTFIDASQIVIRDYITANGVMQILDSPLNPNTTYARPTPSVVQSQASGISTGSKAGIGIGIVLLIIALALLGGLCLSMKRHQRPGAIDSEQAESGLPPSPKELKGAKSFATELDASPPSQYPELQSPGAAELDGRSTHRKSWFSQPRRTHVIELHSVISIQTSMRRLPNRNRTWL